MNNNPFAKPATKRKRRPRVSVKMDHPTHGKIEVHSMKGFHHGEPCTLMASASTGTMEAPVWIQIAKQGRFLGHSAGPFEMTLQTFEEIVRNFKAHPEQIPIDYEHASEADASSGSIPHLGAPAQGWIVDMKIEGGQLYGLVEWGAQAREYIKNGQYKYFSPAIRFGAKDRVSGKPIGARMSSGALTNSPFLASLGQVAAKHNESDPDVDLDELGDGEDGDINEDSPASAADTETEDNIMSDVKTMKDIEDKLAVMTDRYNLAETKRVENEQKVAAKDAELALIKTTNATLLSWKTEREEADWKAEVDVAYETYKYDLNCKISKGYTEANKPDMLVQLKSAPESFRRLHPVIDPDKRRLLTNISTHREAMPAQASLPTSKKAAGDAFIAMSQKIQREEKLPYDQAMIEAEKRLIEASRRTG